MPSLEPPEYTRVFAKVSLAELEYIRSRREVLGIACDEVVGEIADIRRELDQLNLEKKDPDFYMIPESEPRPMIRPGPKAGLVGLALSGGGIRSATFNLGLLQALARRNILRYCDYLSTVSGGGYIGSCLSSLLDDKNNSVEREKFPFRPGGGKIPDERQELKWLRQHSNYLAIDTNFFGWDIWRMIGMYLSGLVLTNLVTFAALLLALYLIPRMPEFIPGIPRLPAAGAQRLAAGAVVFFCIMVIARWGFSVRNLEMAERRWREYFQASMAGCAAAMAALAAFLFLLDVWEEIKSVAAQLLKGVSVVSLLGLIVGTLKSENQRVQRWLGITLRVALALLLLVLFAASLTWLAATNQFSESLTLLGLRVPVPIFIVVLLLLVSATVNTNRITLHHFYRDRLSEAYVIKRGEKTDLVDSNERLELAQLHARNNGAPYHLINATLNVPDTRDRYLRGRMADFFLFSKFYTGGDSTGYRRTDRYEKGGTRLATALAISGAAASPQMGTSSSRFLAFVMTLLNIRLNRWMLNPRLAYMPKFMFLWTYYFVKELFGKSRETDWLLNLSDGGHHENLGVYSLVRRGCRYIIASDAGADPAFAMEDLANLMRKLRVDFGIDVEMKLTGLRPDAKNKNTPLHYAAGRIKYPEGADGILIYIKTSLTGSEPEDLLTYRRQHEDFPDEATSDQFFDEAQFESYRKLGDLIGNDVFSGGGIALGAEEVSADTQFVRRLFEATYDLYEKWCTTTGRRTSEGMVASPAESDAP